MEACYFSGRVDENAAHLCQVVATVETTQADAVLEFPSFAYHDITSQTAATTAEVVAELWLGIRVALAAAVHAVTAHHLVSTMQVIDEEAFLARGDAKIYKDVMVRVVSSALTVVTHLFYVFWIHLAVPFLAVNIIFRQRLGVAIINRWHERHDC